MHLERATSELNQQPQKLEKTKKELNLDKNRREKERRKEEEKTASPTSLIKLRKSGEEERVGRSLLGKLNCLGQKGKRNMELKAIVYSPYVSRW